VYTRVLQTKAIDMSSVCARLGKEDNKQHNNAQTNKINGLCRIAAFGASALVALLLVVNVVSTRSTSMAPHYLRLADDTRSQASPDPTMDSRPGSSASLAQRRPQIIYTIFAGRRNRMKIQEPYWKEMVRIGAIDAVHAWDFVLGTDDKSHLHDLERKYDKRYLHDLERKYDFFHVLRPQDVPMPDFYWFDHNHSLLWRWKDSEKKRRAEHHSRGRRDEATRSTLSSMHPQQASMIMLSTRMTLS
jgi:hypothetical protein